MDDFTTIQSAFQDEEGPQFDYKKFFLGFWKRKLIILLLAAGFAAFFYHRAKNEIPIYQAKVLLRTRQLDKNEGEILSRHRQLEMMSSNFKERLASTLGLSLQIIESTLGSNRDSIFSEFSTTREPVAGYYELRSTDTGHYYLSQMQDSVYTTIDSALVWDLVQDTHSINGFSFRLQPQFVQRSNLVKFRVRPFSKAVYEIGSTQVLISNTGATMQLIKNGTDPQALASDLNRIAEAYVEETLKLKNRDQATKLDALQQRLRAAENRMREAEHELRAFHARYPLTLETKKRQLVDQLFTYDRELELLPKRRADLSSLMARLQTKDESSDPEQFRRYVVHQIVNFPAMQGEPNLAILNDTLMDLERKYDYLLEKFSAEYPEVLQVRREIHTVQEEIIAFASKFLNTMVARESEYRLSRTKVEAQLRQLPEEESRLKDLENKLEINQRLYNNYLTEIQTYSVIDAVDQVQIEILEPATPPRYPINAGMKKNVLIGGGIGLFLGFLISIVIDLLDRRFHTIEEVERTLNLSVIGAIPEVSFDSIPEYHDFEKVKLIDRQLVTHDYSPTLIGESYRELRTRLLFTDTDKPIHTLVITSVGPEEGKSFTTSNLAIILAQQRSNTLLVDADLRRGVLHNTFGLQKDSGFTNYLSKSMPLSGVVQQTHIPNLSLISCGSMIPNPSELLGSLQMKRFLDEARRKFDYVIFDTPPLDAATDAVVLGTQVDGMALVIRAGQSQKNRVKEKVESLTTLPIRLIGVILNGSDTTLIKDQYSYYHY
ncbi:polysaccharide biosynthesis tyrosine autokinase [candidate division KSB1 bacterium]|nr:polysaccharide biosynthesis tyrosine autokinase [candidate division KSB1 bacterium]